jgi:hypothetical protein
VKVSSDPSSYLRLGVFLASAITASQLVEAKRHIEGTLRQTQARLWRMVVACGLPTTPRAAHVSVSPYSLKLRQRTESAVAPPLFAKDDGAAEFAAVQGARCSESDSQIMFTTSTMNTRNRRSSRQTHQSCGPSRRARCDPSGQ